MLLQLIANGMVNGCLYALLGLSFALVYNTTRILHVAHGAVYTAAAYLCWVSLAEFGWPLFPAVASAILASALLGVGMEVTVYAPLARRNAPLMVALLSSLGLYVATVNLLALVFDNDTKLLFPGLESTYRFGPVILTQVQLSTVIVTGVLLSLLVLLLRRSDWGRAIRAVRDNATLAEVLGIDVASVRRWAFALASALAGVASILAALDVGINPSVGLPMLLTATVALIVGGVGTFGGPILGGLLLGLLQSFVVWGLSARWSAAATFGVLIAFLLLRPEGLVGRRRRLEEAWG